MNATAPTTQDPLARIADLERRLSLAERRLTQVPSVFQSGSRFKTNMWRVVGGKPLGYSGLIGATYQTALPASLPEYDVATMPTTADGVGYILSHDTGETALLWNGPPGNAQYANSQAHLWVGMRLLCVDTIKIKITDSDPERFQTFYVNAVLL